MSTDGKTREVMIVSGARTAIGGYGGATEAAAVLEALG